MIRPFGGGEVSLLLTWITVGAVHIRTANRTLAPIIDAIACALLSLFFITPYLSVYVIRLIH
jgi:hypothetical protein